MSMNSIQVENGARNSRDKLTGALNRLHFCELLEIEKQFADHEGRAFLLCLVDVDQLRNINDQAGYFAGDQVLCGVANSLRDVLDMPPWGNLNYLHTRYDGDGLMLLLRCCNLAQGQRLGETMRARIASTPYYGGLRVTVSIGIAAYRIGESIDEVLCRVEQTLHLAKQSGRDCVEVAMLVDPANRPPNVFYLPTPGAR
jgi:diguanylate cyclase (GGDEF)-like protein